jgi:ribosomal protein S25
MASSSTPNNRHIGTLNEKPLHKALKEWFGIVDDRFEVEVDGYIIDIQRSDLLIEIQSRNFSKIKRKILELTQEHRLRLLFPIAKEKWIVRLDEGGKNQISRRKSPKHGSFLDIFSELVYIPDLINIENFSLELVLIQEEEIRKHESGRAWRRRGWVTQERRLLKVLDQRTIATKDDLAAFLPISIPETFTNADLAECLSISGRLAQQMTYCLRHAGIIELVGKKDRFNLYTRIP